MASGTPSGAQGAAPRRVLMVNDIANTAGGMIAALRSRGWEVDLVHFPLRADHPSTVALLLAQMRFALRTAWRSRQYDLLHIHYGYFGLLGRISPRPYVLHCHGTDLRANLRSRLRRPTLAALRGAAHVFYATPDLAQYLPNEIAAKASFCPNIVDTETFRPLPQATSDRDEQAGVRVFFISKLDPTKGMDRLIECLGALAARPEIERLSLFGFGKAAQSVNLPDNPKIERLPRQAYADMPDLIRRQDIVIGQVQLGAIGMSELEVMACSVPLIANFAYADAYASPPPLIQAETAAEVEMAITELAAQPAERTRLGRAAREWVLRNHSAEAVAAMLDARLKTVLDTAQPRKRSP